ncbi:hypothetical protein BpHYR1_001319 [Brachionus plicatilis]|uniref:Uncharacterized protein n=1 Tax=Brachionus plicatilis TaxID=10195 RepID=A0A3M7T793_BRAPC|nr:hypothetical protein BpHYR1_001319 [Brachionus plicatilis]
MNIIEKRKIKILPGDQFRICCLLLLLLLSGVYVIEVETCRGGEFASKDLKTVMCIFGRNNCTMAAFEYGRNVCCKKRNTLIK